MLVLLKFIFRLVKHQVVIVKTSFGKVPQVIDGEDALLTVKITHSWHIIIIVVQKELLIPNVLL